MTPTSPEDRLLAPSARGRRYAAAILIVVAGILCGAIIPGTLGGTICTAVVGVGLVGVVSLVFYDVGLTEDRDRTRQQELVERLRRLNEGRNGNQSSHRDERRSGRPSPRRRIRDEHGGLK